MKDERIALGTAKARFSEIVNRVHEEGVVFTVTRHGRPVAAIAPVDRVPAAGHLADAKGWLDADDPFFERLRAIVRKRAKHRPRKIRFRK